MSFWFFGDFASRCCAISEGRYRRKGNRPVAFDIQEYMMKGVERVVADTLKATIKNPRESVFMLKK